MLISCAVMLAGKDDFPLRFLLFWLFIVALRRESHAAHGLLPVQGKIVLSDLMWFKLNNPMDVL